MAALQAIRKRGGILIAVIGAALFAFIAEELFRSIETTSNVGRNTVGEVYGQAFSAQEFSEMKQELNEVNKLQASMGVAREMTDDQASEQVWEEFVQSTIIEHEADKLGLIVTDEDVQNALRSGQYNSLQTLARLGFANQQTGQFDVAALQDFLKNYDKNMQQFQQTGNQAYAEQFNQIRQVWSYTEKQLRKEILARKFYVLMSQSFISNPLTAKLDFESQTVGTEAEVVAIPYSTVADKDATPTEEELQAIYKQYRELFRNEGKAAALKMINVTVTPSDADREKALAEVRAQEEQLRNGEDVATVIGSSKTIFPFTNLAMSKNAFRSMPDVQNALDSMAVGSVRPTYLSQDNFITTFKLVDRQQASDSVLCRRIVAPAQTPEESATRADSILKAIQGGATFADMAKKYGQHSDSFWVSSAQYEGAGLSEDDAKVYSTLNRAEPGTFVINMTQGSLIFEVLERKNIETKYVVAVVRTPLQFSNETYNAALSKLNRFLADNRTIETIEKNAGKAGYVLEDIPYYPQENLGIQTGIGGDGAKKAVQWLFDEAKAGDVSNIYECGAQNDHLLVFAVKGISKDTYRSLDEEDVRKAITTLAIQQKKGEILMGRLQGVKSLADAQKQQGAVKDSVTVSSFYESPTLQAIGTPEPRLAGAFARTAAGQFTGAVRGASAIYFAQVLSHKPAEEAKFDEKAAMQQSASAMQQMALNGFLNGLRSQAKVKDNRYKF